MCGKATYIARREAACAARAIRRYSSQQRPYRCAHCGLWHLATQQARGKRAQWRHERIEPREEGA